MQTHVGQVIDLLDPSQNSILNMTAEEARQRLFADLPESVLGIKGSFALVARRGTEVRMARSLDRPMRYFLAKRGEGPALIVSDRIDAIRGWLENAGLGDQFHPSYTRMVPAHYVVQIQLVGCPDPEPTYTRFFTPKRDSLPADLDEIGRRYIGAVANEIADWLMTLPASEPVGVCFSGGIDSGAVFVVTEHVLRKLGMNPARLKAFTLTFGDGPDLEQAKRFLEKIGMAFYLEPIEASLNELDVAETVRVVEDYKPLDIEAASMALVLFRGIRRRYPDWRYVIDGEGGDENLKDYPIHENPELTIRSVVNNLMLYHEGWGVGRMKHSLTYSGGLSRSYTRTYATARRFGFMNFSPFTRPSVVEVAEGIPFQALTRMSEDKLYALKGEIVGRGVRAVTGVDMPVFPKRRFQHGATREESMRAKIPARETDLRRQFLALCER
ncbi:MAG: asparagine synthase-related protein [Verrucomicrobiota bacterium]|nr:asparagine synthase-related protein [Verrucomicrobiota bacterium]